MRNKDLGLAIVLVILLILLVFGWAFLLSNMQKDTDEGEPVVRQFFNSSLEDYDLGDLEFEFIATNRTGYGGGGGGSSSKQNKCTDDQVILRLFGPANTHAALWNETIYEEKVCYNEIFGEMFKGKNPHECTGTNKILSLIKEFNSHVTAPGYELEGYDLDVCYGDLSCVVRENSCSGTEKEIVALSDYKNAHLEARDVDDYNILICCAEY